MVHTVVHMVENVETAGKGTGRENNGKRGCDKRETNRLYWTGSFLCSFLTVTCTRLLNLRLCA